MAIDKTINRQLHSNEAVRAHLNNMRVWAMTNGHLEKLTKALDYLRTYGDGSEEEMKTTLSLDFPYKASEMNLLATISKREGEFLRTIIVIAMMWDERTNDWSFHS